MDHGARSNGGVDPTEHMPIPCAQKSLDAIGQVLPYHPLLVIVSKRLFFHLWKMPFCLHGIDMTWASHLPAGNSSNEPLF